MSCSIRLTLRYLLLLPPQLCPMQHSNALAGILYILFSGKTPFREQIKKTIQAGTNCKYINMGKTKNERPIVLKVNSVVTTTRSIVNSQISSSCQKLVNISMVTGSWHMIVYIHNKLNHRKTYSSTSTYQQYSQLVLNNSERNPF